MKKTMGMTYIEILKKRLNRKKDQLKEIETMISSGGTTTPVDNRKFIELKATIQELENVIDLAESMLDQE